MLRFLWLLLWPRLVSSELVLSRLISVRNLWQIECVPFALVTGLTNFIYEIILHLVIPKPWFCYFIFCIPNSSSIVSHFPRPIDFTNKKQSSLHIFHQRFYPIIGCVGFVTPCPSRMRKRCRMHFNLVVSSYLLYLLLTIKAEQKQTNIDRRYCSALRLWCLWPTKLKEETTKIVQFPEVDSHGHPHTNQVCRCVCTTLCSASWLQYCSDLAAVCVLLVICTQTFILCLLFGFLSLFFVHCFCSSSFCTCHETEREKGRGKEKKQKTTEKHTKSFCWWW